MGKFKIGDKVVRISNPEINMPVGFIDIVVNMKDFGYSIFLGLKGLKNGSCEWSEEFFELAKEGKRTNKPQKPKEKMLAVLKNCNNLRLIEDLSEITEDAIVYKIMPFAELTKKIVFEKKYFNKAKKIK